MEDNCWEFRRSVTSGGYSRVKRNGISKYAHRLAYEAFVGLIPEGLMVLHKCDNACCINPSHLYVGDHNQNMRDKVARDRCVKGEAHGNSVLTEDDVCFIRDSSGVSTAMLARTLRVSEGAVRAVIKGRSWRHLQ